MKKMLFIFLFINSFVFSQTNLVIDSIFFRSQTSNFNTSGFEFYKVPKNIIDSIGFSVLISNTSSNTISGCYINVKVFYTNNMLYNESSNQISISGLSQDSLILPLRFKIPDNIGSYTIAYRLYSDSWEYVNSLNNRYVDFEVTNYRLARHNGLSTDQTDLMLQNNSGIGYTFELSKPACLSSILVWTTTSSYDQLVQLKSEIWEQNKITGNFTKLQISELMIPGFSGNINPVQMDFNTYMLDSNKRYFIGVYNSGNSPTKIKLAQSDNSNTVFNMIVESVGVGSVNWGIENVNNNLIPMIELELNHSYGCSVLLGDLNDDTMLKLNDLVYPNPTHNELTFKLTKKTYAIIITDLQGDLIYEANNFNSSFFTLRTSSFENGIYFYHLLNENNLKVAGGKFVKM